MTFPLSATGTSVALYGVLEGPTVDHWNDAAAKWSDPATLWVGPAWNETGCDVLSIGMGWGVDEAQGAVSTPAAGQWALDLYDPDRSLDPINNASPWYRMTAPRTQVRVISPGGNQIGLAYLDSIEHSEADDTGRLEAFDGIGLLAGQTTSASFDPFPPGTNWTIGALIAAVLADTALPIGLGSTIPSGIGDPFIGPRETKGTNAWELIRDAALDCLYYVWVDYTGALQLAEYGYLIDSGTILGDGGICLTDAAFRRTGAGVVNQVSDATGELAHSWSSVNQYGQAPFGIDRRAPGGSDWGFAILSDRSAATMELLPLEALPTTEAELLALRDLRGRGVTIRVNSKGIARYAHAVGGSLSAEGGGVWRGSVRAYQPGGQYDYNPPSQINPRPLAYRVNSCKASTYVWLTPTNVHGAQEPDNAALWVQGASLAAGQPEANRRARLLVDAPLNWDDARFFYQAWLYLWLPVASTPASIPITVERILSDWSPDSVDWPGPTVDSLNRVISTTGITNGWIAIEITPLVWMTAPQSLGGKGLPSLGFRVRCTDETVLASAQFTDYGASDNANGPYISLRVWE